MGIVRALHPQKKKKWLAGRELEERNNNNLHPKDDVDLALPPLHSMA